MVEGGGDELEVSYSSPHGCAGRYEGAKLGYRDQVSIPLLANEELLIFVYYSIASRAGTVSTPFATAYSASK